MAPLRPHQTTIQSFYNREIPSSEDGKPLERQGAQSEPGDGFTSTELAAALDPLQAKFKPTRQYIEKMIAALEAGPNTVMFTGRIVNFNVHLGQSKNHMSAKGWHHMVVKDDTGAICVKLYFARQPYALKLGLLVTIYTPFISEASSIRNNIIVPDAPLATNIFPGREASVHIVFHGLTTLDCRKPLRYTPGAELQDLMTLKSFVDGGNEIAEAKILVCVKSIGAKKTIKTKKGTELDLLEVVVFDDTAYSVLKLWDAVTETARDWKASKTVLIISRPGFRFGYNGKGNLSLTPSTMVDVEPECADARWLRGFAAKAHKAESMKQEWPEGVFDVEQAMNGVSRVLFTIANVDEWARANTNQVFTGWLSLIIIDMGLVLNDRRNMLLCSECCGVPIFSNTLTTTCRNCSTPVHLSLNPRIMGTLLDETGSIMPGRLLWSVKAWEDLFERTVEQLLEFGTLEMRLIEQRLLGMRISVCFGWKADVGRLSVLGVKM